MRWSVQRERFAVDDLLRLLRGQPRRERARKVLDQNAREAFHTAKRRAVDHYRAVHLVIFARVFQAEAFRQRVIDLDRAKLPFTLEYVAEEKVELWPIE